MSAIDDGAMQDKDDDLVKRHPGPFDGPDAELARACAMAVIPFYGDDDEVTHQRIMKDGVWNDHVAVQSALAAIHHLKTKAAALDAAAAVDGDPVDIRTVTAYESGFEAGKKEAGYAQWNAALDGPEFERAYGLMIRGEPVGCSDGGTYVSRVPSKDDFRAAIRSLKRLK